MTRQELRAGLSLASIFALRMLGLFLILPVFAVDARQLPGGDNLTLVGIALGAYGLTQAALQLPFGMASDRYGRKRVIVIGLAIFALGSFLAAAAPDIWWTIVGRALQGAGAISAAVTALAADLTREQHRTKVMALIGSSIGLMFALSLVAAPALNAVIGLHGLFIVTGLLALAAIWLVAKVVPDPPPAEHHELEPVGFMDVLRDAQLARLNFGILALHFIQMAMFVVVPGAIVAAGGIPVAGHWKVYLPVVFASFVLMLPPIFYAERRARLKPVFVGSVLVLLLAQGGFLYGSGKFNALVANLVVFFVVFNILEASLPSLVSRIAPPQAKGTALGIYNTTQSLGLFLGGAAGGWLAQHYGPAGVFGVGIALALLWLAIAVTMQAPPVVALREFIIQPHVDLDKLREQLAEMPGVREAVVEPEKRIAYLKVNLERWDERRVRQLIGGET
ncbi:MAG: MFS transporter [Burkholderiales bacterium]|jgi:MFS family permease|nr:MFS transporter [Zoogloeaceae bacterium]MBP9653301.1 MFS transporter [Rhodocyclaceae bacterium]MCZ2175124.1 MFS transporter [Burkholderiales bacterium]HNQ56865.1 MFS transporter [Candidatus Desulfobacillus denitrificans]MCC7269991.1 MFS transporter [Rhodocyclaceae bacterium]